MNGNSQKDYNITGFRHFWSDWDVVTKATWDEDGLRVRKCERCGREESEVIPAESKNHEHDFTGKETILTEPDCTHPGEKEVACINPNCDAVKKVDIPALGHDWSEWKTVKNATSTEEGLRQRVCADCGYVESQTIAKLPAASTGNQSGQGGQIGTAANSTSGNAQNGAVKTGDNSSVFVWTTVAGAAVVLGAGALGLRRKFRR